MRWRFLQKPTVIKEHAVRGDHANMTGPVELGADLANLC